MKSLSKEDVKGVSGGYSSDELRQDVADFLRDLAKKLRD